MRATSSAPRSRFSLGPRSSSHCASLARTPSRGGAALGGRGDRPADGVGRGPAPDRPLGPGRDARQPRAALVGRRCSRTWRSASREGRRTPPAIEIDHQHRVRRRSRRIEQALGNLVDNSLVHGVGTVTLWPPRRRPRRAARRREGPGFPAGFAAGRSIGSAAPTRLAAGAAAASASRSWKRSRRSRWRAGVPGGADVWIALPREPSRAGEGAAVRLLRELEQRRLERLLERPARVRRTRDVLDVHALLSGTPGGDRQRLRHDVLRAVGVVAVPPAEIREPDRSSRREIVILAVTTTCTVPQRSACGLEGR